jgi:hypothetical protein
MTNTAATTQLPIKRVQLLKNGIAYFEREGVVNENTIVDLYFKSSEMNDVLKSLTAMDMDNGIISSITYDANQSAADQLKDIAIDLPFKDSLTGLLNQLKGGRVSVKVQKQQQQQQIEGLVLGTEKISDSISLNLFTDLSTLVSINIVEIVDIQFLDDHLKKDLQHVLKIFIGSKKKDSKQISLHCSGTGQRTVYISYTVASPIWKTSYRVLLDDDKSKSEAFVQAWAVVDNSTDEDWSNVSLSLVSGLPLSFVHDLYNPRYKQRPEVPIESDSSTTVSHTKHSADRYSGLTQLQHDQSQSRDRAQKLAQLTAAVHVQKQEVGDLFHYDIQHSVTVKRNSAALVPIYAGNVVASRVAVYNESIRSTNPMSSLKIKNTTGVALEGGPSVVMQNDMYVGECFLKTMRPNEEQILPFSVELGCTVTKDSSQTKEHYTSFECTQGYLKQKYWSVVTTTYTIKNNTRKKLNLLLEHKFIPSFQLITSEENPVQMEKTDHYYRFSISIEEEKTTFVVREKKNNVDSIQLITIDTIEEFEKLVTVHDAKFMLSDTVKEQWQKLQEIKAEVNGYKKNVTELEQADQLVTDNQNRIRQNLHALSDKSTEEKNLRQRYVKQLENEEDILKKNKSTIIELKKKIETSEANYKKLWSTIKFTYSTSK